jgi:sigma-54 specific flagellar transcriptional regulator A
VAALPRDLLESEMFGHERGAFTSAVKMRKGRFELADGGTLFLDEIAECPPEVQVKLLRVLQEQEFERVGGNETIRTDVRMIFATNRDLKAEMAAGRFRQDLYFRINVIQIAVPPLRDRRDDIPILSAHFLKDFNTQQNRNKTMSPAAADVLQRYDWPGNVRELRNAIERAYLLSPGDTLVPDALPEDVLQRAGVALPTPSNYAGSGSTSSASAIPGQSITVPLDVKLDEVERRYILAVYEKAKHNKTLAHKLLGIGLKTLYRKLWKYGIEREGEEPKDAEGES